MGGIDARVASTNDKEVIKKELETIIPAAKAKNGYIIHSDHSIPPQVDYETYRYFLKQPKAYSNLGFPTERDIAGPSGGPAG